MDLASVTVADFKAYFFRDFPYLPADSDACDKLNFIWDLDITKAFSEAQVVFNQGLFGTDDQIKMGYLYLTAHYLVIDLRAANAGISGVGWFPVNSRSVGNVSEAYSIPEAYMNDPILALYTQTTYGLKYLSLVLPSLRGNIVAICGGTDP